MSGHSKWSTIKRKKGANDAKRGKLFAKLIRAIEVADKNCGPDPANNASLYQALSNAKSMSVPNSNIENALKRLSGQQDSDDYEEVFYEGYGPHGVAILVECLTDNRNRTSSDVKSTFSPSGSFKTSSLIKVATLSLEIPSHSHSLTLKTSSGIVILRSFLTAT